MTSSTGFLQAHALGRELVDSTDYKRGLCAFGVVAADTGGKDISLNASCHAGFKHFIIRGEYSFVVDAIYPYGGDLTPSSAKMYAKYILTESPYSPMFAEKNIEKGWKRRYFLYTPHIDANLLTGGCVALRMLSEKPNIPYMWYKFTQGGMGKDMAFLLAHACSFSEGELRLNPVSDVAHRAVVPSNFLKENVIHFIKGEYIKYGKYSVKRSYCGFNGMWGEGQDRGFNFITEIFKLWKEELSNYKDIKDRRVALFNHNWNLNSDEFSSSIDFNIGVSVLCKIVNNYERELHEA